MPDIRCRKTRRIITADNRQHARIVHVGLTRPQTRFTLPLTRSAHSAQSSFPSLPFPPLLTSIDIIYVCIYTTLSWATSCGHEPCSFINLSDYCPDTVYWPLLSQKFLRHFLRCIPSSLIMLQSNRTFDCHKTSIGLFWRFVFRSQSVCSTYKLLCAEFKKYKLFTMSLKRMD